MDPRGLWVTLTAEFPPSKHTKELLFLKFCDKPAEIEVKFWMDQGWTEEGQTDVEVEIIN